jgi:hypothetical protein
MNLDYQKIKDNYILRMVVFSVFLFKDFRRNETQFIDQVKRFIQKRIGKDINIEIEIGPKMSKDEIRDNALDIILNDKDSGILNLITIKYNTGSKEINMLVDINDWEKYENYLYS